MFQAAVNDYILTDLEAVIKRVSSTGDSNKLGVAYVRAGQYEKAKLEFSKGAVKGNVSSMNNLGNIFMIEKDYAAAEEQYRKVLAIDPENKTALKGLENVRSVLED